MIGSGGVVSNNDTATGQERTKMRISDSFDAYLIAEAAYDEFAKPVIEQHPIGSKARKKVFSTIMPKVQMVHEIKLAMARTKFYSFENMKLFQQCMTESVQEKLLKASIYFENQLYQMTSKDGKEATAEKGMMNMPEMNILEHQLLFEEYVKVAKKMSYSTTATMDNQSNGPPRGFICQVDPSKVLADEYWYNFLRKKIMI